VIAAATELRFFNNFQSLLSALKCVGYGSTALCPLKSMPRNWQSKVKISTSTAVFEMLEVQIDSNCHCP